MTDATTVASATMAGSGTLSAQELDDRFVAGWNAHDVEQLTSLMSDDVVYDDASWPAQMHGREDVRAFLESTWRAVPDLTFEHGDVLTDASGTMTARRWKATATHTGPWDPPGLAATGRRLEFEGATFLESRDGKLCRIRVVYDVAALMRQLAVLPDAGS